MPQFKSNTVPTVVLNDTRVDHHLGCSRVITTLETLLQRAGCHITAFSPAHLDWRQDVQFMRALECAKLVVVNGEGSIHHDSIQGKWLLEAGAHARLLGIPAVLLNCSWQDNGPALASKLRDFSLITAREPRSAMEIINSGTDCKTVPDLSFYLSHERSFSRHGIGFTDSVVRRTALELGHLRSRMDGINIPMQFSKPGLYGTLNFMRTAVGKNDLFRPLQTTRILKIRLDQLLAQVKSEDALLDRIAALRLLVTGRFHAVAFAIVTCTPFLAAATNTHKIVSLAEEIGLREWRTRSSHSVDSIRQAADTGWETGELKLIDDFLQDARQRIDSVFNDIGRML